MGFTVQGCPDNLDEPYFIFHDQSTKVSGSLLLLLVRRFPDLHDHDFLVS